MQQKLGRWTAVLCLCAAMALGARAQSASRLQTGAASQASVATQPVAGGKLHGVVKSGNIPLPGVTVTAQNTLTGKRYATTTDITGAWSMTIPQNGRYVIRTQFAAFAQGAGEALLNASSHDQAVNFELMLASRAAAAGAAAGGPGRRRHAGDPADGGKWAAESESDQRADG